MNIGSRFSNKIVVITGGTKGIGFATAKAFINEGAKVIITGRGAETGEKAAKELGSRCEYFQADAGQEEDWKKLAVKHPKWDILFNNAGSGAWGDRMLEALSEKDFFDICRINLFSVVMGSKIALETMKGNGGVVINNSSVAANFSHMWMIYGTSKAAVCYFTKACASLYADRGIRFNAVLPGMFETEMTKMMCLMTERGKKLMTENIPMGRVGKLEEVAKVVLDIADSTYMNGAEIEVSGGSGRMVTKCEKDSWKEGFLNLMADPTPISDEDLDKKMKDLLRNER